MVEMRATESYLQCDSRQRQSQISAPDLWSLIRVGQQIPAVQIFLSLKQKKVEPSLDPPN